MLKSVSITGGGGGGGGTIGGAIVGGIDTRVLYIHPNGILAQTDNMRVVSDGIEFGDDPSFNDVVFGQDRVGGESGFTMRLDDAALATYSVGINQYSYGGGNPSNPGLAFVAGNAFIGQGTRTTTMFGNAAHVVNITGAGDKPVALILNQDDIDDYPVGIDWAINGNAVWSWYMPEFFNQKFALFNVGASRYAMVFDPSTNSASTESNTLDDGSGNMSVAVLLTVNSSLQYNQQVFRVENFAGTDAFSVSSGLGDGGTVTTSHNTLDNGGGGVNLAPDAGNGFSATFSAGDFHLSGASAQVIIDGMPITSAGTLAIAPAGNLALSSGVDTTMDVGGDLFISATAGSVNFGVGGQFQIDGGGTANVVLSGVPAFVTGGADINDSVNSPGGLNYIPASNGGSGSGFTWHPGSYFGFLTSVPWATPGDIGVTTPAVGAFTSLSTTQKITKYNNVNTAGMGVWAIRAQSQQPAQTTGQTLVSYPPPANGTFIITGYLNITAVTLDVIKTTITYKDNHGASQTITPLTGLGVVGNNAFITGEIFSGTSVITVVSTLTTSTGSITYDQGATITQVS